MQCSQPNLFLRGGERIFFHCFLQMLLATNSMNFTSKPKGCKCKNFNANSAYSYSLSLNTIQHSWSPSTLQIPATFLLRDSDSELALLSCTGKHPLECWAPATGGKGKVIPDPPLKAPTIHLHTCKLELKTLVSKALQQNHGIPLQLEEPALSDKLPLRDSTACAALIACYSTVLGIGLFLIFPI